VKYCMMRWDMIQDSWINVEVLRIVIEWSLVDNLVTLENKGNSVEIKKKTNLINFSHIIQYTTRKPEKTNGITDGIFPSVIYTDENNSVSKSVGIYRRFRRRGIQFVWKYAMAWWRQAILPTDITEGFKLW